MEEEFAQVEERFADAIAKNDPEMIGRFVTDDWIIIKADGGIIDRQRFLYVIRAGTLTHQMLKSDEMRVRLYGETAIVSVLTRSKGRFMGQEFSTRERSTDVFVKRDGQWRCALTQLTGVKKD